MKINYNNKNYSIPKPFDKLNFGADKIKEHYVLNRLDESGTNGAKLPVFAYAIYCEILIAEKTENWSLFRKGINWFQKNFINEYYVLLD